MPEYKNIITIKRHFFHNYLQNSCKKCIIFYNLTFFTMKYFIFFFTILFTLISNAAKTVRYIDALKVVYTGNGTMTAGASDAGDYTYKIEIMGLSSITNTQTKVQDSLVITPTSQSANSIFINEIVADGALNKIKVTFPPGKDGLASCVRNIKVNGYVNNITIIGGDLGAPDAHDGQVKITGSVKQILVKGKKHKIKNTKNTEFWGGNIWADISVTGAVSKIIAKGGNIFYFKNAVDNGAIDVNGLVKLIAADGVIVKTSETVKVMFGGAIKADIFNQGNEIKQIRAKGGRIVDGGIYCRQLKKLYVNGQKATDPRPNFSVSQQGISKICVQTTDPNFNYKDCSLKNILVKNGAIFNSLFSAKGNLSSAKVTLENPATGNAITNSIVRVGTDMDLSVNNPPSISPNFFATGVVTETRVIIPFTIDSQDSDETLAVHIHNRGPALDAIISNYYGQTFALDEAWKITSYPESGMFVWVTKDFQEDCYSNIIVRVSDNGTPNKYDEMLIYACVTSSNVAPSLTISPADNPRIVNMLTETNVVWTVNVFDMNLYDSITFSIENNSPGLLVENTSWRNFKVYSTNLVLGTYSNIVFKATDDSGASDSISIDLFVISNDVPIVSSTLTDDKITSAVSNNVEFYITANAANSTTLDFLIPSGLPSGASYTQAVFSSTVAASNKFSWTPAASQTGTYNLDFKVVSSVIDPMTGEVAVVITITNDTTLATFSSDDFYVNNSAAAFPGSINKIYSNSGVYDSKFIAGVKDEVTEDWANASYLGKLKSLKIMGTALGNSFISLKKISIWQSDLFDFSGNDVWIDKHRATDSSQQ